MEIGVAFGMMTQLMKGIKGTEKVKQLPLVVLWMKLQRLLTVPDQQEQKCETFLNLILIESLMLKFLPITAFSDVAILKQI